MEARASFAEAEKYKLHVSEIDKITALLLGLAGRLARAENALCQLPPEAPQEEKVRQRFLRTVALISCDAILILLRRCCRMNMQSVKFTRISFSLQRIIQSKRDKLQEQLEEAKKLKENTDRRAVQVRI